MNDEPSWRLASDDPEWVAARRREWASGQRPTGQELPKGLQSAALATIERHRAVLDVLCRRRHVARVLVPDPGVALPAGVLLQVACEVRETPGGGHSFWPLDAYVDGEVVIAACRCGRSHSLSVNRLITESRQSTPGRPTRVGLSRVVTPPTR